MSTTWHFFPLAQKLWLKKIRDSTGREAEITTCGPDCLLLKVATPLSLPACHRATWHSVALQLPVILWFPLGSKLLWLDISMLALGHIPIKQDLTREPVPSPEYDEGNLMWAW